MTKEAPTLYECMYILVPTLEEDEIEQVAKTIEQTVTEADGEIKGHYDWGRRRFAYKIRQWTEGIYRILYFTSMGPAVDELKRLATQDERIIRAMVVIANPRAIYKPGGEGEEEEITEAGEAPETAAEASEAAAETPEATGSEAEAGETAPEAAETDSQQEAGEA